MNDIESIELLKKEHFDLAIGEIFESCGFGVFELLGINKYILTHSASLSKTLGHAQLLGDKQRKREANN